MPQQKALVKPRQLPVGIIPYDKMDLINSVKSKNDQYGTKI